MNLLYLLVHCIFISRSTYHPDREAAQQDSEGYSGRKDGSAGKRPAKEGPKKSGADKSGSGPGKSGGHGWKKGDDEDDEDRKDDQARKPPEGEPSPRRSASRRTSGATAGPGHGRSISLPIHLRPVARAPDRLADRNSIGPSQPRRHGDRGYDPTRALVPDLETVGKDPLHRKKHERDREDPFQ